MGNLLGYFNEEVGKLPAYFEHHFTYTLISNFHVGDYPQHSDWGKQCFIRPNGIPNSEGDRKLHLKWRSDEAIILHTKMFFLYRTELEGVKIQLQDAGSISTIGI